MNSEMDIKFRKMKQSDVDEGLGCGHVEDILRDWISNSNFHSPLGNERTGGPNRNFTLFSNWLHCQIWKDRTVAIAQVRAEVVFRIL